MQTRRKRQKSPIESTVVENKALVCWEPPSPRLIELSITASHVGDISTITENCDKSESYP